MKTALIRLRFSADLEGTWPIHATEAVSLLA